MNADALLAHYERIADAPDAIARLRRFILDLAVRGKLVPQDPDDEPVSSSIQGLNRPSNISEGQFDVPPIWAWMPVGAIAESRLGKMLDKAKNKGRLRRYLRNVNVRWFDFDLSDVLEMPFEDSELPEFQLRTGDVLICEGGEPGRAAVWDEREAGMLFQKAIHRVRLRAEVSPYYFVLALRASADDGRLAEYFTGTGISHFTGKSLQTYLVPLPPFAEQHRIVAKVDELMALCEQLEAAKADREARRTRLTTATLARLNSPDPDPATFADYTRFALDNLAALTSRPDQVKQLRQTILNLAVRGKLVPQDPDDEPVSSSIQGLNRPSNISEGQFDVPPIWAWMPVGAIAESRLGKMLDKAKNKGRLRRYLRNVNVRWFDFDLSDVLEMPFEDSELPEFQLRTGDVLICEGGEPGRAAVWDEREAGMLFQKAIHRVRLRAEVSPYYFVLALRASADDGRLAEYFNGTGISHFTGKSLQTYLVPLPPFAEQRRIVAKVEELMALCDRLETSLANGEGVRGRLLEALLADALSPANADPVQLDNGRIPSLA
jgi:type I restriction enzyme S subunit